MPADKFKKWYLWGKDLSSRGRKLWANFIRHKYLVFRKYGLHCTVMRGKNQFYHLTSLKQLDAILEKFRKKNGMWSDRNIKHRIIGKGGKWETRFRTLNLAIESGPSGLFILDIDTARDKKGKEQLQKLLRVAHMTKKDVARTLYVSSGSGNGAGHYYFYIGKLNTRKFLHRIRPFGMDLVFGGKKFNKNGILERVVSPYSIHIKGGLYQIANPTTAKPLPINSRTFYLDRIAPLPPKIGQVLLKKFKPK